MAARPEHDPRYDQGKRDRAKALYDDGLSVRAVAESLEISPRRAWVLLHEAGAVMRPEGRPRKGESE